MKTVEKTPINTNSRSSMFRKLREGLKKSGNKFKLSPSLRITDNDIAPEILQEIEAQLLSCDVGLAATNEILGNLISRQSKTRISSPEQLRIALREDLIKILTPVQLPMELSPDKTFVILMVGTNGAGKTTTVGKLAKYFLSQNLKVMLAAGDTFRAAAIEQLHDWGKRNSVPVISQHQGADSASVIYDALVSARARGIDILLADTAGRLHNQEHLMEELKKIIRVIRKLDEHAPHEIMLVLDAGIGQNGLLQAEEFKDAVGVTGLTLTKLDGTAKGGLIFALAKKLGLPIRYIGIGESSDDLQPFLATEFVDALLETEST